MKFDVIIKGEYAFTFDNGNYDGRLLGTMYATEDDLRFLEKMGRVIGEMNYNPTSPYEKDPIAVRIYLSERFGSDVEFVGDQPSPPKEDPNLPPPWAE